ncbi:MAG: FIST N-terminal domain-containing protein [Dongiaceae bacterium]
MAEFRAAHAAGPWPAALELCLARLGPLPADALGFLYATDHHAGAFSAMVARLRQATGVEQWVGTVGFGIAGEDDEGGAVYFDEPAVAVMVAAIPGDGFRLFGAGAGAVPRSWLDAAQPGLAVIHGDPRRPGIAAGIAELAAATGAYFVGGLTASRNGFPQLAGEVVEGALCGALLAGTVPVAVGLSQGCSPIGPARSVTAAQGNVIQAIDGEPALEVMFRDIAAMAEPSPQIFAALPVPGSEQRDYLVRPFAGFDRARGWLALPEPVEVGQPIRFARRDRAAAEEDLGRMLDGLAARVGDGRIRGGLYVSCLARGPHLFARAGDELAMIRRRLGDFPMAGFFANGEICRDRLYTHTGVLTLFL